MELLVVVAIIALLMGILLPTLGKARKAARTMGCASNIRQLALASFSYAAETNTTANLSWQQSTQGLSSYSDLRALQSGSPANAGAAQVADILRRNVGPLEDFPPVNNFMFRRQFWHLGLIDGGFLDVNELSSFAICPEDELTLSFQDAREQADAIAVPGAYRALTSAPAYLPYMTTYQPVPASYSDDHNRSGRRAPLRPGRSNTFVGVYNILGPNNASRYLRNLTDVRYPSDKVYFMDMFDRHFYPDHDLYYRYGEAKQPLGFFDGSVRSIRTNETGKGFDPYQPASSSLGAKQIYYPDTPWDPPTIDGAPAEWFDWGYYRWTRGGLKGRDTGYGGRPEGETYTGQDR